jgi:Cu/Ag efflux protein CusF
MARRRNNLSEFMDGFNQTYGSVRKVLQDKELMDIAKANVEDLAPVDDVVMTPGADGGPASGTTVPTAPRQTRFLGQTYDKPLTDGQVGNARNMAMAGVMKKYGDPVGGLRLEQQAREGEQRDRLTALQIGGAERQAERDKKSDAHTAALEAVDQDVATWAKSRLVNPDGTPREMTIDDQLATGQYRVSKLIAAGKLAEANALAKDNMSFASNKIQLETQARNEALTQVSAAAAAGDLSKVAAFYDRFVPDGAKVAGIVVDPDTGKITIQRETIDGRPAREVTFKDRNELLAGLNVFKDPMSLYNFSQAEFARNLQTKADARAERGAVLAENADKRADKALTIQAGTAAASNALSAAQLAKIREETENKKALGDIQESLVKAIENGDKAGETKARAKLMSLTIGAKGVQMSDTERKANFFLASGAAKTPMEAAQMAHEKVQSSPKDDYLKLTTSAMPLQGEQLDEAMATLHGANWKTKVQGRGAGAPEKPATQDAAHTQAKAALAGGASKAAVNERLKSMGYAPLP